MRPSEIFTRDEMARLTARSDAMGAWAVLSTWAIIAGTFAMLARWPSVATFILAVVVLGGRQLALAVLMHEGAHRTFFRTRWLNDRVADVLCAWPIWGDVAKYKAHHLGHHRKTGRDDDPDLSLVTPFPTTRASLVRRFVRDLLGLTGLKLLLARLLMDAKLLEYTVAHDVRRLPRRAWHVHARALLASAVRPVATNAVIFAILAVSGHAWVYLAWPVAYFTTFALFLRIRSMAEHACTARTTDPFENTRTTRAGPLARLTVAPFAVNYHLEHHLLVAVPWFRLARVHALLRARGLVAPSPGYLDVLRIVSSRDQKIPLTPA
jgi:fatty acid desaturase